MRHNDVIILKKILKKNCKKESKKNCTGIRDDKIPNLLKQQVNIFSETLAVKKTRKIQWQMAPERKSRNEKDVAVILEEKRKATKNFKRIFREYKDRIL